MTDKQIKDNISNFYLVCYSDNKTNELARIEQYHDNDISMYSDIDIYRYGYNAEIIKPEELIKQIKLSEQKLVEKDKEIERLKQGIKHYQRGMSAIINTATEIIEDKENE